MASGIVRRSERNAFRVVCVEGNIGSGKSTFMQYMAKIAPSGLLTKSEEPVDKWRNFKYTSQMGIQESVNILENLYSDPKRWSFGFNLHVLLTRLETHKRKARSGVALRLMERSVFSTYHCFVQNSYNNGELTEEELIVLRLHFDLVTKSHTTLTKKQRKGSVNNEDRVSPKLVDLFVYLRTPPDICLQRMRDRGRGEEDGVPIDFLQQLHDLHEDFFVTENGCTSDGTPVLVIDNSQDLKNAENNWQLLKEKILSDDDVV